MSKEVKQTEQRKEILTIGEEWARSPGIVAWMNVTGELCVEFERLGFHAEDVHGLTQEQFALAAGLAGDLQYAIDNLSPTYDRAPGSGMIPHVLTQSDLRAQLVPMVLKAGANADTLDLGPEWGRRDVSARWLRATADMVKHLRGLGFTSYDAGKCVRDEFLPAAEAAGAFTSWVSENKAPVYTHGDRADQWPSSREIAGIVRSLPR